MEDKHPEELQLAEAATNQPEELLKGVVDPHSEELQLAEEEASKQPDKQLAKGVVNKQLKN